MTTSHYPEFFFTSFREDDTYIPSKAHENDTGWDVKACEDYVIKPFETAKIRLGIRCFAPEGWWLELRPRSSTMAKKNLHCLYGVIDSGYEGEIILAATWIPPMNCTHINDVYNYFANNRLEDAPKVERLILPPVSVTLLP